MQDVISMGPFIVKWSWVILGISGFVGYLIVKNHLKGTKEEWGNEILDSVGNSIFLSFVIWKLSLILFEPVSVLNNPMVLLYFSGGYKGWILAVISIFIYLFIQAKKHNIPISTYMQVYGLGFSSATAIYHFIPSLLGGADQLFHFGEVLLSVIFTGWFYKNHAANQVFQAVIWFGIGQIFMYFFMDVRVEVLAGLSKEQLIFLVVSFIGFLGLSKWVNFKET
ncbi:hypothetical protein [Ammoniphilus resinae]|uniref:Prolipoprotein diacylglyceryl transferase n=1 Tax=Ammoniphilus resinae TaxID=861532 RepID=A0ABS4GKU5_9BACL|nr:hypothetical protein [Ammoniphilus resinae]MBP1930869.1 hypothetical protein [Ammoniphilus resinae]